MAFSVLKHTLANSMPLHIGPLNTLPNLFPSGGLLDFPESSAFDLLQGLDPVSKEFHLRPQTLERFPVSAFLFYSVRNVCEPMYTH